VERVRFIHLNRWRRANDGRSGLEPDAGRRDRTVGSNERAMHVSAARELYVGMGCLSRASAFDNMTN
jgi:hypothetical protein